MTKGSLAASHVRAFLALHGVEFDLIVKAGRVFGAKALAWLLGSAGPTSAVSEAEHTC